MRNLSDRFKTAQSGDNRNYLKYADITLKDGTVLRLTNNDFWSNGFKFDESVSDDNAFTIGAANINTLVLTINNFDEKYSDYDFTDAEVTGYIGLMFEPENTGELQDSTGENILDSAGSTIIATREAIIEKIRICTMAVVDTPYQHTTIVELTCEDNLRKFDRNYSDSKLEYPATRKQIIQDACDVCGVTLNTTSFAWDDYIINTRPEEEALTFRQVLAWVCQIGCQYAKCDSFGRLCIGWYDTEIADADRLQINSTSGFTPNLDDVVITGVQVTEYIESTSDENEAGSYLYGAEGYVLSISNNKLISEGTGNTVASMIGERCVGMSFRPFSAQCLTDIALEAGDAVLITDRNGKKYKSFLTNVILQPGNFENVSCNAESAARNSTVQYSQNTQTIVEARKSVQKEKTAREKALDEFKDRLDSSSGAYTTVITQSDGSQIFYLHDKPTLEESKAVWKMAADAWGVSTDGGKTWNGGMTVDGDTIVRILNAVGVNANWINTGAITVKDTNGNILFQVDMDTKKVIISGDVQIGGGKTFNESLEETRQYAENVAASAKNMTMQLSNDYQAIPVDSDGKYTEFPTDCITQPIVMYGSTDVTSNCKFTITKSQNITGTWDDTGKKYTVTGLTADNGWVDIKATYLNTLSVTQRFTLAKQYAGPQGAQGIPGVGKDGKTTYLHIRYAPVKNPSASQMSTAPNMYIGTYTDFTAEDSTDPAKYTWAQFKGDQGVKGNDGASTYTWIKYATRFDGLDMTDSPDYVKLLDSNGSPVLDSAGNQIYTITQAIYIGIATNKTTSIESDNPYNYTWSRFRGVDGTDGANGLPGVPGADGKTPYIHFAYANSADGKTDFSVDNSKDKLYIGQYTDYSVPDSTDPTKYAWTKIKGDDALQVSIKTNVTTILLGKDNTVTPATFTANAYSRNGNHSEMESYSGVWEYQTKKSTDTTWKIVAIGTGKTSSCSVDLSSIIPDVGVHGQFKIVLRDKSGGTIQDQQTYNVALDSAALTQADIVDILSNNGAWKGMWYDENTLYISFNAARGGTLILGGKNNGNGEMIVQDANGDEIGRWNNNGITLEKGVISGPTIKLVDSAALIQGFYNSVKTMELSSSGLSVMATSALTGKTPFYLDMSALVFPGMRVRSVDSGKGYGTALKAGGIDMAYTEMSGFNPIASLYPYGVSISASDGKSAAGISITGKDILHVTRLTTDGLSVSGTKNRIVNTQDYAQRLLYCYEMPSPMFGDIGEGVTDEQGICTIMIDDIFGETIVANRYQVFLQKQGPGDIWVEEKTESYFTVKGTPNLKFSWEMKAKQSDYTSERLEVFDNAPKEEEVDYDLQGYEEYVNYIDSKTEVLK